MMTIDEFKTLSKKLKNRIILMLLVWGVVLAYLFDRGGELSFTFAAIFMSIFVAVMLVLDYINKLLTAILQALQSGKE